ncbi:MULTISPECIES: hypothetical protein [unclassified Acinetobacter]|uniref:hypothetical protein n=1 Tax=unclassified Acinetobacter TaxID=196816 RepID=UPI00293454AF|nr:MULTISPECIES: hypothetical protein [unclassified Acinetobacter]WOE31287.1 hypothetical protein QSG84_13280 [Acinetobacter sp. SAAs470]WOE39483.1 hypothetical protein QSG86_06945 [Acinetobacter sp. SAAs474]
MLDTIENKIYQLKIGQKLILGSGIEPDTMQNIMTLCDALEAVGVIRIINVQQQAQAGKNVIHSLMLQKIADSLSL